MQILTTIHYFTGKMNGRKVHTVAIGGSDGSLVDAVQYEVKDKKEAIRIAKENGYNRWNF